MTARTVLFTTSFPPAAGGLERVLYETNRRLHPAPSVLAPAPASAGDMDVWAVPLRRTLPNRAAYAATWRVHPALHYLRTLLRPAARLVARERPEVLQCGHVYVAPLTWLLAARIGRPWLTYAYGQEVWRGGRMEGLPVADSVLRGGALRHADRIVVLGQFGASLLAEWGVAPQKVVSAPFGPDTRPAYSVASGQTLLSVCRLVPRKGVDMVIRALPSLMERFPELRYRIVGDGPDRSRLEAVARDAGVDDRVDFLGRVSDERLHEAYERCALFVLPSRRSEDQELEGLGLVYLEAGAHGRAVVAGTSGGEADAVVSGVTGVLVDGASAAAVEAAIGGLLADRDALARMGVAGWKRVRDETNWDRAAQTVGKALDDLGGPGRG